MRKNRLILLLATAVCCVAMAEGTRSIPEKLPTVVDEAYFKTLQTTTVESTPDIVWRNLGPAMSGYCDQFTIHPTDPNWMYTTLDMGNHYYTDDNAQNWTSVHDWDQTGDFGRVNWVDFSRQDPDFGLAVDEKGFLMRTTDRGKRYEYIYNKYNSVQNGYPVRSGMGKKSVITVDPTNDNIWYIGPGQFWRTKAMHRSEKYPYGIYSGFSTNTRPSVTYEHPDHTNTDYGYILITKDKGINWTEVRFGYDDLDVGKIFVNPTAPNEVYVFANRGFFKSTDYGDNWARVGEGLPYNTPRDGDMHYDAATGKVTLFLLEQTRYEANGKSIASTGGVYRSDDLGATWSNITGDLAVDMSVLGSESAIKTQYLRTVAFWMGKTTSEIQSSYPTLPTSVLTVNNRLVVNPTNPNEIYLSNNIKHDFAFAPVEVWKTEDGGKHWFAALRSGSYWTNKKHASYWSGRGANDPLGKNATYAHLDYSMTSESVWVGTRFMTVNARGEMFVVHEQQVLKSSDGGVNWQQIDDIESTSDNWVGKGCSNLPGVTVMLETGMNRNLFLSGEHGLWVTGDMGDCTYDGYPVRQIEGQVHGNEGSTSTSTVAVHPNDSNKMFILSFRQTHCGYLRTTDDGGKSWYNVGNRVVGFDPTNYSEECNQRDLIIDPVTPDIMFFALPKLRYDNYATSRWIDNTLDGAPESHTGVYRSLNGGKTWALANSGMPDGFNIWSLEMDPNNSTTLYASSSGSLNSAESAVAGGALFRTTNSGDTWEEVTIPSEIVCVNHLHVDKNNGYLYLSAGQYAGTVTSGGTWLSTDQGATWQKIFMMPYVKYTYTSDLDPNVITVDVGAAKTISSRNPGAYISRDGGSTWVKANYRLGQPSRVTDLKPDKHNPNVFWAALYGSGFYRAEIAPTQTPKKINVSLGVR